MHIRAFWAQGFRSLRDVRVEEFGAFNVFHGPNGAGKSNLMAAMHALRAVLAARVAADESADASLDEPIELAVAPVALRDRCFLGDRDELILGATLAWQTATRPLRLDRLDVEVCYHWAHHTAAIRTLRSADIDLIELEPAGAAPALIEELKREIRDATALGKSFDQHGYLATEKLGVEYVDLPGYRRVLRGFLADTARGLIGLIGADRLPRAERATSPHSDVSALLSAGALKQALLRASRHPDRQVRRRYAQFQQIMRDEPLCRPPFAMTEDPVSGAIELIEYTSESILDAEEVPLDLLGAGIAQLYHIVAQALLRDTRAVAIESPEAGLHPATTGVKLRDLIQRLVADGHIDQVFIATHSDAFDLDSCRHFEVELAGEDGTRIEPRLAAGPKAP